MAFSTIEPMPELRADMRAAQMVQASLAPYIKKGAKLPTISELMLNFEPKKQMETEDLKKFFKNLTAARGGVIKHGSV